MSANILLTLSASVLLGTALAAPNACTGAVRPSPGSAAYARWSSSRCPRASGGTPLGGPPAGPVAGLPPRGGAGAPPREFAGGPPRLDGAGGLHGLERGGHANFRGVEGRAAAYSANSYTRNSYASYGYGRRSRHWPYAAAAAAYAYGGSDASSEDRCHYVPTYRRYGTRRFWSVIETD